MKAPRTTIYLICFYCLISSIVFMALSILSIISYACMIDFSQGELRYMMYLLYFRLPRCAAEIPSWDVIGVETGVETPQLPGAQTTAVLRTFIISIIYLALNFILFLTIFRTMSGIRQRRNKHIIFWSYFSPLFFTFIAIIALDFIASALYIVDFFRLWFNSDVLLDILEVTNKNEVINVGAFENVSKSTRSLPSMIIFIATSKALLLLTLNFALVYIYFVAAWKVCRENQRVVLKVTTSKKSKKKEKTTQQVQATNVQRVESTAQPESSQQQPKAVKKNEKKKTTNIIYHESSTAQRDETELPSIHHIEPSSPPPDVIEPKTATFEKVKINGTPKVDYDAARDETELPEIVIPRITYQKQPSEEEIPLPPPPSFNNKKNQKTKF